MQPYLCLNNYIWEALRGFGVSTKSSPLKRKSGENRSLTGKTGVMCISYMTSLKAKSLSLGCWSKIESPCLKQILGVLEADSSEFSIHRRNRSVVSPHWVFLQVGSFLKTRSFSLQESLSSTLFLLLVFHWVSEFSVSAALKFQNLWSANWILTG